MSEQEAKELIGKVLDTLATVEGRCRLFSNLRRHWTKVRTCIERRRYEEALKELGVVEFYVDVLVKWCKTLKQKQEPI